MMIETKTTGWLNTVAYATVAKLDCISGYMLEVTVLRTGILWGLPDRLWVGLVTTGTGRSSYVAL